jgi:hypothetical protein
MVCTDGKLRGRRVALLYRAGPLFACRRCLGLVHASKQKVPAARAMRRAQKIKMRLGGSKTPWNRFRKSPACIGEPIGGCATRRMLPTLMQTACWRNRCPHLDNFSAPCRLAENASAGAAMAGSDQASPGRRHDISINSNSAAPAQ